MGFKDLIGDLPWQQEINIKKRGLNGTLADIILATLLNRQARKLSKKASSKRPQEGLG